MVFSSFPFLLLFLPIVLIGYYALSYVKNDTYQRLFIILASLFFYGYQNVNYLALILASIAVNYLIALGIQKQNAGAKPLLILGVLFNVALIGYFKYYDFFIENINLVAGTDFVLKRIMLPLGISFFTFQQLSFLVSVYQGEEKVEKLLGAKIQYVSDKEFGSLFHPTPESGWRYWYDRQFDRVIDNSKILAATGLKKEDFLFRLYLKGYIFMYGLLSDWLFL